MILGWHSLMVNESVSIRMAAVLRDTVFIAHGSPPSCDGCNSTPQSNFFHVAVVYVLMSRKYLPRIGLEQATQTGLEPATTGSTERLERDLKSLLSVLSVTDYGKYLAPILGTFSNRKISA